MEVVYRANDGTEFTNEQDCINHESVANCLCNKKHFIAFNSNLEPYDIAPDDIESVLERMEYFVCLTDEAASALESFGVSLVLDTPNDEIKTNVYYGWEITTSDTWESFSDIWEAINKETERLMRIENALSKSVEQAYGE